MNCRTILEDDINCRDCPLCQKDECRHPLAEGQLLINDRLPAIPSEIPVPDWCPLLTGRFVLERRSFLETEKKEV